MADPITFQYVPRRRPEPVVDPTNLGVVTSKIEYREHAEYAAWEFTLHLRGNVHWQGSENHQVRFLISHELLARASVTREHILSMELNKVFARQGMPPYVRELLINPELEREVRHWLPDRGAMPRYVPVKTAAPAVVSGGRVLRDLQRLVPGVKTTMTCPACLKEEAEDERVRARLLDLVQHLNDTHHWSREAIADWLETLDVDLTFPTEAPPPDLPLATFRDVLFIIAPHFAAAREEARRRRREDRRWRFISDGGQNAHALSGYRRPQYVVLDGAAVSQVVEDSLYAVEAVEVGEESGPPDYFESGSPPVQNSSAAALKVYEQNLQNQLEIYKGMIGNYASTSLKAFVELADAPGLLQPGQSPATKQFLDDLKAAIDAEIAPKVTVHGEPKAGKSWLSPHAVAAAVDVNHKAHLDALIYGYKVSNVPTLQGEWDEAQEWQEPYEKALAAKAAPPPWSKFTSQPNKTRRKKKEK